MVPLKLDLFTFLLCLGGVYAVDLTLQRGATGPFVVQATIAKLDNAFSRENSFWDIQQSTFMRTLAYVESEDGVAMPTLQGLEGIWMVRINLLSRGKRIIEALPIGITVQNEINQSRIIEWDRIFNFDDMDIPLYNCAAARLLLLFSSDISNVISSADCQDIPDLNSTEIGDYWHQCYHEEDSSINPNNFATQYQELLTKNENGIGI